MRKLGSAVEIYYGEEYVCTTHTNHGKKSLKACIEVFNEKGLTARASENLFEDVCNVGWDEDFSLDAHLEQLHELCWYAVNDDNTFTHRDDE